VQGDIRPVQNHEQFLFVVRYTAQSRVQHFATGLRGENLVKAFFQVGLGFFIRRLFEGLQISIQLPDAITDILDRLTFFLATGDEFMDCPFGMNPAQSMEQNMELPGIVTEDHQLFGKTVMQNAAQQGTFGGDTHMAIFSDRQLLQMLLPVFFGLKMLLGVSSEQ